MSEKPMHIALQPLETAEERYRFFRAIWVDGVIWGYVGRRQAGVHGSFYRFYEGDEPLCRKKKDGTNGFPIEVSGDKHAYRNASYEERKAGIPTLQDRLLARIRELIAEGRLRHPDVVKKANDEAMLAYRKERAEEEAQREANFKARAEQAIASAASGLPSDSWVELFNEVIKAMEWARDK